ncbi:MAG: hypothetical protein BJ554DRAFT_382, partial [Olpidium bornovanus]
MVDEEICYSWIEKAKLPGFAGNHGRSATADPDDEGLAVISNAPAGGDVTAVASASVAVAL